MVIAGRPYAIPEIAQQTDGLLYAFYPGPFGGQAIGEILFGEISPSGRLPVSIPASPSQIPVYYNAKASCPMLKYSDAPASPLFGFGEGGGYSQFAYENVRVSSKNPSVSVLEAEGVTVTFDITNTGKRADTAVPQLYIRLKNCSTVRRWRELKAFCRVELQPGQRKNTALHLTGDAFSVWDAQMHYGIEPCTAELLLCDRGEVLWQETLQIG